MRKINLSAAFTVLFSTLPVIAQEAPSASPECPECSSGFGLAFFFLIVGLAGGVFVAKKYLTQNSKPQVSDNFIELDARSREIDELKAQIKTKESDVEAVKADVEKLKSKIGEVLKKADENYYNEIVNSSAPVSLYNQVGMIIDKLKADLPSFGVRNYLNGGISVTVEQFNSAIRAKDGAEALRVAGLFVKEYEEAKDFYKEGK
ncbi:hypothetical protein J6Y50_04080 [bacterium]|nr:hypothetical protein [bacterium]